MVEGQVEPQEATRVGAMLRERRVRSGFDIAEVEQFLRIRRAHLEAIEAGRFEDLPGPFYAAGFVRTYAAFLGLDAAAVARRFHAEMVGTAAMAPLNFPLPVAEAGTPKAGILLVGAIIVLLAYGGWYMTSMHRPDVSKFAPAMLDQPAPPRVTEQQTATADPRYSAPLRAETAKPAIAVRERVVPGTQAPPVGQPPSGQTASAGSQHASTAGAATGGAPPVTTPPALGSESPSQPSGTPSPGLPQPTQISSTATTALAAEPPA